MDRGKNKRLSAGGHDYGGGVARDGLSRAAANRAIFMDEGLIVEEDKPEILFSTPKEERTKLFLSKVLH
jgi:ABC-type histidine transport system ATPase subunit